MSLVTTLPKKNRKGGENKSSTRLFEMSFSSEDQTIPCASIASATLTNPAIFAPRT